MSKKLSLNVLAILFILNLSFAKNGIEGTYRKSTTNGIIYLKVKKINDSLFYFHLKDYDTTKANFKQRSIIGTFGFSKNIINIINADFYLGNYFFLFKKKSDGILMIDPDQFHMYYTFDDILGEYIKITDSVVIDYSEFKINKTRNNIDFAKTKFKSFIYDFPSTKSKGHKIEFQKNEKVFAITTVGSLKQFNPLPVEVLNFTLIEIPGLKLRKWIKADELDDNFN